MEGIRGGEWRGGGDERWRDEGWRDGKVNGGVVWRLLRRLLNSKFESLISLFCCVRCGMEEWRRGGWRGKIHSKEMKWRQTREAIRCH